MAIGQTLIWAVMYYSFSALFLTWEQELGWSKAELSGAFTTAVLISAFLAPMTGRFIDRGYGTITLSGAALLGAVGLVLLSQITAIWHFYAVYFLIGVAMSAGLYESCFALLTHALGPDGQDGDYPGLFSGRLCRYPIFSGVTYLEGVFGWRMTMWILAAILVLVVAPLHWYGGRAAEKHIATKRERDGIEPSQAIRENKVADESKTEKVPSGFQIGKSPVFWLLAISYAMIGLNHGAIITHMLPLFDERGIQANMAVFAASMIGPMQVAGRVIMLAVERRFSSIVIFVACFASMAVASIALLGANAIPWLVVGFVFLQGAGAGTTSILRPVTTADLLGSRNFGVISGFLAVPARIAGAAAPTIAALIWGVGGYNLVLVYTLSMAVLGLFALLWAASFATRTLQQPQKQTAESN